MEEGEGQKRGHWGEGIRNSKCETVSEVLHLQTSAVLWMKLIFHSPGRGEDDSLKY